MSKEQEAAMVEALVAKQMGEREFAQFCDMEREILSADFEETFDVEDWEPVLETFQNRFAVEEGLYRNVQALFLYRSRQK